MIPTESIIFLYKPSLHKFIKFNKLLWSLKDYLLLKKNSFMKIGTITLHFVLPSETLKEKRRFINSIKDKTRAKFNVSIAEIDLLDKINESIVGIAFISNDGNYTNQVVSSIVDYLEKEFIGLINDYSVEIL